MMKKSKGLSAWQLTMMALGSVVGGSFFLGSSVAIHAAGPSILIAFIAGGILVNYILRALSQMTVANPGKGSFRAFTATAFGKGSGFVVGWVYWTGLVLGMSSEATAVSILLREWFPRLPISFIGSVIIVGVTLLNLLGTSKLSKLESSLAAIKLVALLSFIITAVLLIIGIFFGNATVTANLSSEPLMAGGFKGLAGSMLIVIFAYAGFEVIGLAASEAAEPKRIIPKAIRRTVFILLGLYILSIGVLLPLIPTSDINEKTSPFVSALNRHGFSWAGTVLNIILISAILSTMLAVMFGLGRMIRSLADDMLAGLGIGLFFPSVYLFLISSGGFALLFTYSMIMATHIRLHTTNALPKETVQIMGYPIQSVIALLLLITAIISMPFVSGQASGLIAGVVIVAFYLISYVIMKWYDRVSKKTTHHISIEKKNLKTNFSAETSEELTHMNDIDN